VHERVASDVKCIRTALERVDGGSDIFCATDFKSDLLAEFELDQFGGDDAKETAAAMAAAAS
jgi:hypothetical protein